jgi:hypothetical protein
MNPGVGYGLSPRNAIPGIRAFNEWKEVIMATPQYEGFKQKLFEAEVINEINGRAYSAYKLSWAKTTTSGWSYGWLQFDLGGPLEIGKTTFLSILKNAKDTNGTLIIPKAQVDGLYEAAQVKGGQNLTDVDQSGKTQRELIDAALGSAYGIDAIDKATSKHLDNLIKYADSVIKQVSTAADKQFFQNNPDCNLGRLWLCDIHNQGFTSRPQMVGFLNGGKWVDGFTKDGDLTFDDILGMHFRERQHNGGTKNIPWDTFRRITTLVDKAGSKRRLKIATLGRSKSASPFRPL